MRWPWSKERTPAEIEAATLARAERKSAHAALAEEMSRIVSDAADTLGDHIGGKKK
jgi:hypothetical protein